MRLAGVARSKRAAIDPMGLDLGSWREVLESGTSSASGMLEQVLESDHPSRIFVDRHGQRGGDRSLRASPPGRGGRHQRQQAGVLQLHGALPDAESPGRPGDGHLLRDHGRGRPSPFCGPSRT